MILRLFNHYEAEFYDDIQDMIQQISGDELPQQVRFRQPGSPLEGRQGE